MKDFRSTKRITQANVDDLASYPLEQGQTYFTTDTNVFYRDYFNQRVAITNVYKITTNDAVIPVELKPKIPNSILIQLDTSVPEYSLWYIDENGTAQPIGSSGGGGTYTAGDGLNLTGSSFSVDVEAGKGLKFTDVLSPNKELTIDDVIVLFKETADWIIQNGVGDFKIIQKDYPGPGTNTDKITIFKTPTTSGGVTGVEVDINAKTRISELDFGGW